MDRMALKAQIKALQEAYIAENEVMRVEEMRLAKVQADILIKINGDALEKGAFAAFMAEAESLQKRIMLLQFDCTRLNAARWKATVALNELDACSDL